MFHTMTGHDMTLGDVLASLHGLFALLMHPAVLRGLGLQMLALASAGCVTWLIGPRLRRWLSARIGRLHAGVQLLLSPVVDQLPWAMFGLLVLIARVDYARIGLNAVLLRLVVSLVLAWVVIRLVSRVVRDPAIARLAAVVAFLVAALNIAGLLDATIDLLDGAAFHVGSLRLSVLLVLKALLVLVVSLWAANLASRLAEQRLSRFDGITPAMQVLASKLTRAGLLTLAVVVALGTAGIDLTAFAVFSGAIGVGLGFGLQKVVSNLISGVILLLDASIKPGDVIELDNNTYGWITRLNARYASVNTRDGKEYLIPNEELITQRVVNWTYSNNQIRLHVDIGIAYSADVRLAMRLATDAAKEVGRVLGQPPPICLLTGFGDSSVDLQLRFWISDARQGTANVRSAVLLGIWDRFREHGIEFPFPQRDITVKNWPPAGASSDLASDSAMAVADQPLNPGQP